MVIQVLAVIQVTLVYLVIQGILVRVDTVPYLGIVGIVQFQDILVTQDTPVYLVIQDIVGLV